RTQIRRRRERHLHRERRAAPGARVEPDAGVHQLREAIDDGEAEAHAVGALARLVADLVELFEYQALLGRRDARPGVAHLDTQLAATPPAADEDPAALRVAHGVRGQIAQDAVEEPRIGAHPGRAG